jgi:prolyl-tRNA editing enzyme YbaK/EbsC (Cys-tRNA(Pro) deacylase)
MSVYAEKSIFSLGKMYINGGKRGFLVEISPADLIRALPVIEIEAAQQSADY